jgi:predicted Zn finger-like uncharacterized protein
MPNAGALPLFDCPICQAVYRVVEAESGPQTMDGDVPAANVAAKGTMCSSTSTIEVEPSGGKVTYVRCGSGTVSPWLL